MPEAGSTVLLDLIVSWRIVPLALPSVPAVARREWLDENEMTGENLRRDPPPPDTALTGKTQYHEAFWQCGHWINDSAEGRLAYICREPPLHCRRHELLHIRMHNICRDLD